jgi:uracil-DNA glycosylase
MKVSISMAEDRAALLTAIAQEVRACQACRLHEQAKNGVPGAGDPNSEIMFIGEGPGFHEDQQGLPFVGRSGDLLVKLLRMIGLTRDQVFIANVVKHRPPENRDPMPDEIAACASFLDRQIQVMDPLVIVTLGRFSMARYFPNAKITAIHGQPKWDGHRAFLPLFHPAAVLRSPSLEPQMEADFRKLPALIARVKTLRAEASSNASDAPPISSSEPVETPPEPPPPEEPKGPPKQLTLF